MYVYINTFDFRIMNSENIFHRHLTLLLIFFKLKKIMKESYFILKEKYTSKNYLVVLKYIIFEILISLKHI